MANMIFSYKTKEYIDCKTEQPFKIRYIANNFGKLKHTKAFCIETEETVAGFPDVISNYSYIQFCVTFVKARLCWLKLNLT